MNISHLSVKRPVTTTMVFAGILILGIISWLRLPQELFPSISYPQITIVTNYENAAPEEIESLITKVVEEAVGPVNDVKRVSSVSKEGTSLVIVDFNWGTKMNFAALSIREKIDLVKERLPKEADEPIVMKYNPFELPIMNLSITGDMPSLELRETTRKYIKESIEKINGVASATISGGDIKEIVVEIDQARLRASGISIVAIVEAIKDSNLNYPAGTIKESVYEYLIRTMGEFETIEEIGETPTALEVPGENSGKEPKTEREKRQREKEERRLIYLKDIADIKETIKEKTSVSRYNGKDSVSLVIKKQSGVNSLFVAKAIRREIKKLLEEKLPKGIDIKITYDQSTFIQDAISNLRNAALQGGILAFFVLFFFLKDLRSSLTITLAIPISLMATFCLMYFTKINLNMMSLGGLALGIGMLVDNSIVVIENIFRHRQLGKDKPTACGDGANEMFAPILGSTLTTVAVFFPFAFVVGIAGQIFKQLSFTITFSLMVSILVAISLIPVIISLGKKEIKLVQKTSQKGKELFSKILEFCLKANWLVIIVVLVLFIVSLNVLFGFEKRFLPEMDQRQFIVKIGLPPGTRVEETDRITKKVEAILLKMPDAKDITANLGSSEESGNGEEMKIATMGSHEAQIMVNLKKKSKKNGVTASTKDIISILKTESEKDQELKKTQIEYLAQETSLGGAVEDSMPIVVEIRGSELGVLREIANQIKYKLREVEGLHSVKIDAPLPTPETKIKIMKDKASLYGLSVRDIAMTSQVALRGYPASKFKKKEEEQDIDIKVRLRPRDRANLSNLRRLLIRSPLNIMVALQDVAYLVSGTGPTEIKRIDQERSILATANILNRPLKDIFKDVERSIEEVSLQFEDSKDYSIELGGEQKKMKESFASLAFALILAIVLVYMIMASEFESLWQPFIIMFCVPLSIVGVTASLYITKTPLSVVAYLGIIMLGGIVVNNGIVLIDFINNLRKQGLSPKEASIQATQARLRPILMTSLTTILGMLPLALAAGEGSELRSPLARTVIGGLLSSTFLTLIFIPIMYIQAVKFLDFIKKIISSLTPKVSSKVIAEHGMVFISAVEPMPFKREPQKSQTKEIIKKPKVQQPETQANE